MKIDSFISDLEALKKKSDQALSEKDIAHLQKMERWGRLCTLAGYASAWVIPNPLSIFLLSQGRFCRWAIVAHHVLHQGYDGVPNIPPRYKSNYFARGWRRIADWVDWIYPEAWALEHNSLHHYHLSEEQDPDLLELLAEKRGYHTLSPMGKFIGFIQIAVTWKYAFYAPSTMKQLYRYKNKIKPTGEVFLPQDSYLMSPKTPEGRAVWKQCWLYYGALQFVLVPALFLPFGVKAAIFVLLNSLLAEILTNIHSFIMIVPNHAGEDLYRFNQPASGKGEFYLRQIIASTNYRCGGDLNDFLHGWLNYQIEHHLWPTLTLRQCQILQPQIKALCKEYRIPYAQESIFKRLKRMAQIYSGATQMKVTQNASELFFGPGYRPVMSSQVLTNSGREFVPSV